MMRIPVIIVGAGPAGSVLAGLLAQRGVETLLLDKATFPREKVCGDYLSPGTIRLLAQLDLLDYVRSAGAQRLWGMTVTSPDGTTFTAEFPAVPHTNTAYAGSATMAMDVRSPSPSPSPPKGRGVIIKDSSPLWGEDEGEGSFRSNGVRPFALSIPRVILDNLLLQWARSLGVTCIERFRVTDLIRENGHVCGVTGIGPTGPETYRGRIVVGADGRDSVVARRLGLHRPHPTLRRMALVAYYDAGARCNVPLQDHGLICIGNRSYCILNKIGERLTNAAIVMDQEIVQERKGQLDELFDSALQAFPLARDALRDAERREPIRCLGPLAFRTSRNVASEALLVGDAAGFYDPFTGEGVGHALYSARLAARAIVSALAGGDGNLREAPLQRFDAEQHQALTSRQRLGAALQAIIRRPRTANAVARLLQRRQPLADLLLGVIGDLLPPRALFSAHALLNVLYRT